MLGVQDHTRHSADESAEQTEGGKEPQPRTGRKENKMHPVEDYQLSIFAIEQATHNIAPKDKLINRRLSSWQLAKNSRKSLVYTMVSR